MSTTLNGQKLVGYAVAGGILLVLADLAPKVAVGTSALMLLAVGLTHADQFTTLANWVSSATSTTPANQTFQAPIAHPGGGAKV